MVSKKLKDAVRTSDKKAYIIAQEADMHPTMLSQLINDILNIQDNDERVIAVGKVLGLKPEDCFNSHSGLFVVYRGI